MEDIFKVVMDIVSFIYLDIRYTTICVEESNDGVIGKMLYDEYNNS